MKFSSNAEGWVTIGIILLILIVGAAIYLYRQISRKKRKLAEPPPKTTETIPVVPTRVEIPVAPPPPPAPKKKLSLSQAIAGWIPLLKSQSKEKEKWEPALIQSDMGPRLTSELLTELQNTTEDPQSFFKRRLTEMIEPAESNHLPWKEKNPLIIFIVGVNGVGKTTTIVKLANFFKTSQNLRVAVVGADTFRKAAIEQLERGCQRIGVDFFSLTGSDSTEGADPAAVVFDGLKKFSPNHDVILVDTSGRLQNKKNLMEELKKMKRVAGKSIEGAPHEIWLIVDATLGQNAVSQGRSFHEAVGLTGMVLTKMDGLSRGGTIFQLYEELKTPIRFIGFGEKETDLEPFKAQTFTEELFDQANASS